VFAGIYDLVSGVYRFKTYLAGEWVVGERVPEGQVPDQPLHDS